MSALWTSTALAAATGGRATRDFAATGISIDSRTLRAGDLFIALVGDTDGHRHVAAALAAGACAALVHRIPEGLPPGAPLLIVPDTLTGLHAIGSAGRARFLGRLVAVTGSVGKTTAKEMLRSILAAFGPTHAAEASHNNHWGVPLTLARLPEDAAFCVAEIGMNHAGEIAPLAALARPHATVITTIGTAHIGHLGSRAAIADEKAAIQTGLGPGGLSILPADTPLYARLAAQAGPARILRFGNAAAADARPLAIAADADGSTVTARILWQTLRFHVPVPGAHMAMNALACLTLAAGWRLDLVRAAAALAAFRPLAGRGVRRSIALPGGTALLLDESYNASTSAVRAALAVLALTSATRRIAVLGDMLEMGDAGPAEHLSLLPDLAAADLVFACGPLTAGLFAALPPAARGAHAPDSATLAPLVAAALRPGDAVLVKGSLGMRMKTIISALDALGAHGAEAA
jgi:UDP-N-acetylmuramoyl-tripeptide--D-alanyl-D-alanine ligase